MKHQITLVGGQILPVYLGIVEKQPSAVHLLYTKDSKEQVTILKRQFKNIAINAYQIEPFDYDAIKVQVETIVFDNSNCDFELNLTGGTKIMAIASQQVFNELSLPIFYIDQKHTLFDIAQKVSSPVKTKIGIDTFFKLSGHDNYSASKLENHTKDEISLAEYILKVINAGWYWKLYKSLYNARGKFAPPSNINFVDKETTVVGNSSSITITTKSNVSKYSSSNILEVGFTGLWWEILVAQAVSKWKHAIDLKINVSIQSKTDNNKAKNEIDIVLNTGKNLIFIECKAGDVTQDDINKIKAVAQLYGGIASRSILVSRKSPPPTIVEKCHELGIDIFSQESSSIAKGSQKRLYRFTNLSELPKRLDLLMTKFQL